MRVIGGYRERALRALCDNRAFYRRRQSTGGEENRRRDRKREASERQIIRNGLSQRHCHSR